MSIDVSIRNASHESRLIRMGLATTVYNDCVRTGNHKLLTHVLYVLHLREEDVREAWVLTSDC